MDKKLVHLLDNNISELDNWINTINDHNKARLNLLNIDQEKFADITIETANVLGSISELFFKYGSFKDTFDNSKFSQSFYGPYIPISSLKTGSTYKLGIDDTGIFLNTYLRYSKNIRHMDDGFWRDILSLSSFGTFELIETEFYGKGTISRYPDLFKNQNSVIFRLIRNYFVGTTEQEKYLINGELQVKWTPQSDFRQVIANACQVFKIFYKLNYGLWKVEAANERKKI